MPRQPETLDRRYEQAAKLLGLADAEAALQHSGQVAELVYVWEKPLGRTALLATADKYMLFEPGVLLPVAFRSFRQRQRAQ